MESSLGVLGLVATKRGLCAVLWQNELVIDKLNRPAIESSKQLVLQEAIKQINQYLDKKRTAFELPLDLRGTPFQIAAWQALVKIPYGSILSYAEQAKLIGRPQAWRAVGRANSSNPLPVILPCHRVVGFNQTLTGFSGGLSIKRKLLKLEGVFNKKILTEDTQGLRL